MIVERLRFSTIDRDFPEGRSTTRSLRCEDNPLSIRRTRGIKVIIECGELFWMTAVGIKPPDTGLDRHGQEISTIGTASNVREYPEVSASGDLFRMTAVGIHGPDFRAA